MLCYVMLSSPQSCSGEDEEDDDEGEDEPGPSIEVSFRLVYVVALFSHHYHIVYYGQSKACF